MPSPKKTCPHPGCEKLIDSRSNFCRNHFPHTKDHIEKVAQANRGRKSTEETKAKLRKARRERAKLLGNSSMKRECKACTKSFFAKPSIVKNGGGVYCSSKCMYKDLRGANHPLWKGGEEERECPMCGIKFKKTPAAFKNHTNYFCSASCRSIYNLGLQKTSGTDIEIAMQEILDQEGVKYTPQYPIRRICVADFFLPKNKTVIFCDGEYWHNLPKGRNRDIKQNAMLQTSGYHVLRFWGAEIKQTPDECAKKIRRTLLKPLANNAQLCLWGGDSAT